MSEIPLQMDCTVQVARSSMYKLLSSGFRYPSPEIFEAIKSGEFQSALRENLSLIPYFEIQEQGKLSGDIRNDVAFEDFGAGFVMTFDTGIPEPPSPPYEGLFRGEPRTAILLEVSEFYRHFGLSMSQKEGKRELPDHISAELEFLYFLTFKGAQAAGDGDIKLLREYLMAQKDFLERHLIKWVPGFCGRLQNIGNGIFYAWLARITSKFIQSDLEWIKYIIKDSISSPNPNSG